MKLKINVTKWDISNGTAGNSAFCPVALAFVRAGIKKVEVNYVDFTASSNGKFYDLPKKAQKFIDDFDSDAPVKPFSFNVNIPKKQKHNKK